MLNRKFMGTSYAQIVNDNYYKKMASVEATIVPKREIPNGALSMVFNSAARGNTMSLEQAANIINLRRGLTTEKVNLEL